MIEYGFIIVTLISMVVNVILYLYIKNTKGKKPEPDTQSVSKPTLKHDEIKAILTQLINDAFMKRKVLIYDLNNMRLYDVEKEMGILANDVLDSIGEPLKQEFYYYYADGYLVRYIVNVVELLLLDDLKKRRPM